MENPAKGPQLDIPGIIHMMQSQPLDSTREKSKFFPYIETYGKRNNLEENLLMNKTIKFRESYMHNRTLRYMEPNFSYNQVLKKLQHEVIVSSKPKQKAKIKFVRKGSTLKEIISKTELFLYKESQPSPYRMNHSRFRPQFPNGIAKGKRMKSPQRDFGAVSPDLLRVTNLGFRDARPSKKGTEVLTFYQDMPTVQNDDSLILFEKTRLSPKRIAFRETSPKITCDAVSNTDLPV